VDSVTEALVHGHILINLAFAAEFQGPNHPPYLTNCRMNHPKPKYNIVRYSKVFDYAVIIYIMTTTRML